MASVSTYLAGVQTCTWMSMMSGRKKEDIFLDIIGMAKGVENTSRNKGESKHYKREAIHLGRRVKGNNVMVDSISFQFKDFFGSLY